ncbi:YccF domain-containing protein [Thalassotalea agarivorans]|uniref:Inner membrane protein YccF n=1 Tax=Thalassotalea agarivorans TaxID=349064 RepID=A0A1I0GI30_THASX|nr:YccF domain-containing protein [Thalassotalea agarivorans]SET70597.1 Uncharacterized membrane protein YccF, DUF307 family [Thalassotalea agarivorans]
MRLLGNILWLLLGGLTMALIWWAIGVIALISIVGIPWARSCFVLGAFSLFPFGKEVIARDALTGREDIGTGALGLLGNIIWFIFPGLILAIFHLFHAVFWFITIIGIPFGIQHLKLAEISFAPVGKTVVDKEVAYAAYARNGEERLNQYRRD